MGKALGGHLPGKADVSAVPRNSSELSEIEGKRNKEHLSLEVWKYKYSIEGGNGASIQLAIMVFHHYYL